MRKFKYFAAFVFGNIYTNSLVKLDFAINSVAKETNCILSVSKKRLQEKDGNGGSVCLCYIVLTVNTVSLFIPK